MPGDFMSTGPLVRCSVGSAELKAFIIQFKLCTVDILLFTKYATFSVQYGMCVLNTTIYIILSRSYSV